MSNGLLNEILRQLGEMQGKIDRTRDSLESKFDEKFDKLEVQMDAVQEQISGEDGLRDRVKSLEIATQSLETVAQSVVDKENTPVVIHHTTSSHKNGKKPKVSDNVKVVAAGGVGAGVIMTLVESIPEIVKWITSAPK